MGGRFTNVPDVELARRAAGGDGGAFVRLYDQYSAEIFESVLDATGSVDTASAATQTAFLKLLTHPPALGAPDGEVMDRLRTLAIGAGAEGAAITRPAGRSSESGWLRSETVLTAGQTFNEDWSEHLHVPADRPRLAPPPPVPVPVMASLPQAPPPPPRRTFREWAEDLPLRSAGVAVLLIAMLVAAAAVGRMGSDDPNGATDAAVAADETSEKTEKKAEPRKRARDAARPDKKGKRARKGTGRNGFPLSLLGDDEDGTRTGRSTPGGRRLAVRQVAGQRRASSPTSPQRQSGGDGPVRDGGTQNTTTRTADPAPSPEPAPAPAPAPAPEPAPAPAPAPVDDSPGNGYGHDKPRGDDGNRGHGNDGDG